MRLTALCICGTLLALSSVSWTKADSGEGDLLGVEGFGPCAATLQREGPCRHGQDEGSCPYLFSLPPLTVHLPKQLRELEKIMKDLQKLKDNVDQLRKMCADCTVSQTERECGKQREKEHVKLDDGAARHEDEGNRVSERNPERLKDLRQECGTDRAKMEKTPGGDGDTDSEKGTVLEERGRKKWEAERESVKGVVKENEKPETLKEVADKNGKTQTEGAKGKDKLKHTKVPATGGNERLVDKTREKVVEKNNGETDTGRRKENDRRGDSSGDRDDKLKGGKERKTTTNIKNEDKTRESDHYIRRDETKETDKKTQTEEDRSSDGIKMFKDHDEHTNKDREQHREERKKEIENGIKVGQNNEKPKQTEGIGHTEKEKTIKEREEAEEEKEDRETGTEIKTDGGKTVQSVQRDGDGELASNKEIERTDFVSISPNPRPTIRSAPRHDTMDLNEAATVTSSLPPPPLSSSHLITDVNQGTTKAAYGPPPQSKGSEARPDAEAGFRSTRSPTTTAMKSTLLGDTGQQVTAGTTGSSSATTPRPGADFQGHISSTTVITATTSPSQNFYTATFPGVTDRSRELTKKNISSNTKTGVKPPPGRGPKPGEKHKPGIKPEADQKLKNPKNDRKPDRSHLPDKKTKHDQKQRPSHQKPTGDQKPKPGKDPQQVQTSKPKPDHLSTDQNLKNNTIPAHDQDRTTDQTSFSVQKPQSPQNVIPPVQRPISHQTPVTVNATISDKDPLTNQESESSEITIINQESRPEKIDKTDPKPKPEKKPKSEEKTKPHRRPDQNQHFTPVHRPESERSETTSLTPKPKQKPVTELMETSDDNPPPESESNQDSKPGQKFTLDHINIAPDQKPELSQTDPLIDQSPKPGQAPKPHQKHPKLVTSQKTKPKPGQATQTNQEPETPGPGQMPDPNSKAVPGEIPEAESNKTSKPRTPTRQRPPTGATLKPGATSVQRPKPAVQPRPSPKTRTDLDPPHVSRTSDGIQNSQTDVPPTSDPAKQIAVVTHPPADTESRPSMKKTITLGPKTSNSLETKPLPRLHTLPEGFTMSPNSRITSDLRPQTAGQPSSIPMTTRPNKINRGIHPSVIPSTSPGSTKQTPASNTDPSLQAQSFHNVEQTALRQSPDLDGTLISVPSPRAQSTSTLPPDFRFTTPATSGPEHLAAEPSTPSARELRVKINQVAVSPNGRSPDKRPKEQPEDNQGGSRPDRKLPTRIPSKVAAARRDCSDHLLQGQTKSGVYLVTPDIRSKSFHVPCDMELGGGGWTLLQRRRDGSVSFNRTWAEYRAGFGELRDNGEFWLGNNPIHLLTRDRDMVLRVELEDFDGVRGYAEYEQFRVASERLRYRLTVGGYSGTAGDAFRFSGRYDHNNKPFTTPDRDNDRYPSGNCGAYYSSGWWFDACMAANLNGRYYLGKYIGVRDGIFWGTWHDIATEYYPTNERRSFKTVRMLIRPKGFAP